MFFFSKQKTAYEVRISDWSSDVCSSDLPGDQAGDVEVGRPDAVEGRQRTAEHVIAAAEHPGTFQRPEIGNAFHHAEQAFVAAAVGADGAEIGRASCRERVCQYV